MECIIILEKFYSNICPNRGQGVTDTQLPPALSNLASNLVYKAMEEFVTDEIESILYTAREISGTSELSL